MPNPHEHMQLRLIDGARRIVGEHRPGHPGPDGGSTCSCGAQGVSDHPRHVAERIVDGLGIRPDFDELRNRFRYASAWFDWELTQLEGAEC